MKCVIGLNVSSNAAAVVIRSDGNWCALEEERFSRIKQNRDRENGVIGFSGVWFPHRALGAAMDWLGVRPENIVASAFACTGDFPTRPGGPPIRSVMADLLRHPCRQLAHHLAHAWSVNDGDLDDGDMITVCDGSGSRIFGDTPDDNIGWERLSTFVIAGKAPQRVMTVHPRYYRSPRWNRVVRSINSLGYFYQWMASHCVPAGNEPEGSMMALAAYGNDSEFRELIEREISVYSDGGFLIRLNDLAATDLRDQWPKQYPPVIFGERIDTEIARANLAWATQNQFERVVVNAVASQHAILRPRRVAVSGGSFLNCVLNARLESVVSNLVLRPAMHDAGIAFGCALAMWHQVGWNSKLEPAPSVSAGVGCTASLSNQDEGRGDQIGSEEAVEDAATRLVNGEIIAVVNGRNEYGPRALGNRSVLASPAAPGMKARLNSAKRRAGFRPFALVILQEDTSIIFGRSINSPFMLQSFEVLPEWRGKLAEGLHVDGTTRTQTVGPTSALYPLLMAFRRKSGLPALINTSLNEKGRPIAQNFDDVMAAAAAIGVSALYLDFEKRYFPAVSTSIASH